MQSTALSRAIATIVALAATPQLLAQDAPAPAQNDAADDVGEIVVSGYRASLSDALAI